MTDLFTKIKFKKDDLLCKSGDKNSDLFYIENGEFLVCIDNNSAITAVAKLGKGQFIGELAFFDKLPRSANVFALEDSTVIRIELNEADKYIPKWMQQLAKGMSSKIRQVDQLIGKKGIKRDGPKVEKLSIEQQTHYFKILKNS